jgi:hypothetical protein
LIAGGASSPKDRRPHYRAEQQDGRARKNDAPETSSRRRLRGVAAISVIARGSARDHGPITASKIPVKSKMARRRIRRSLDAR